MQKVGASLPGSPPMHYETEGEEEEEGAAAFKGEQLFLHTPMKVLPWGYVEAGVLSVDFTAPAQWWDG